MNKNIAFATSNATSNTTAIAVSGAKQHTADYLYGYPIGKRDGRIGIFDVGDSCDHTPNGNMKRCVAGYTDEYKSVCGNTNNRPTPSCK